ETWNALNDSTREALREFPLTRNFDKRDARLALSQCDDVRIGLEVIKWMWPDRWADVESIYHDFSRRNRPETRLRNAMRDWLDAQRERFGAVIERPRYE